MKARICVIYANTKWGYQMKPLKFPSIRRAKEYAKEDQKSLEQVGITSVILKGWEHDGFITFTK